MSINRFYIRFGSIREEKLEVVGILAVSSESVVRRLISLQPFLEYAVPSQITL